MAIALVTGDSRGIGRVTALLLAKEEYTVTVNYQQDPHATQEVVSLITQAGGGAPMLQADISDENQVTTVFTAIDQHDKPLVALVSNVRVSSTQCAIENLTAERINRVFSINITGYFLCCRKAAKCMALRNGGSGGAIANVSSAASWLSSPREHVDYAVSGGMIDMLTTGLPLEVTAQGIRVNCVRPGLIYTEMHASGGEPERTNHVKSNIPIQYGRQAEEVAQAIAWLLSNRASYVTGSFIDLMGGE